MTDAMWVHIRFSHVPRYSIPHLSSLDLPSEYLPSEYYVTLGTSQYVNKARDHFQFGSSNPMFNLYLLGN